MDLYAILKCRKNAKPDTIKKAFRKAAMRSHPDRGGDAAEFQRVQLAWDVLGDPARRARYDATGEYDDGKPVNDLSEIASILYPLYQETLNNVLGRGMKPEQTDIAATMNAQMAARLNNANAELKQVKKRAAEMAKLVGRWTVDDNTNVLEDATRQMLAGLEIQVTVRQELLAKMTRAQEFMKGCRFRQDVSECTPLEALRLSMSINGSTAMWRTGMG